MGLARRSTVRAGTLGLLLLAVLGLAYASPAMASEHQSGDNIKNITQQETEIRGWEIGDGKAIAGDPTAKAIAVTVQHNSQEDGGNTNALQDALNLFVLYQDVWADTGDAHAEKGGYARSGDATAIALAVTTQINVQVIVGDCKGEEVLQQARNAGDLEQFADAFTDHVSADAGGKTVGGDAAADTFDRLHQINFQVHRCS